MANILIAGDSWGRGEWGPRSPEEINFLWKQFYNSVKGADYPPAPLYSKWKNLPSFVLSELKEQFNFLGEKTIDRFKRSIPNKIQHLGLEHYLTECGHSVTNISIPGEGNSHIIDTIRSNKPPLNTFDVIFYFQTDPFRDLHPYASFQTDFTTYEQLISWQNSQLTLTYTQLNEFGSKIYMLGGCSKLNLSLLSKYKNLIPLIESITEFLFPNYNHPELWPSDWYHLIDKQFDIDSLDKILYNKQMQDLLAENNYCDLFWPDGMHPNRFGHKKVFEYINENIFKQS
jgi:hypothetical protein